MRWASTLREAALDVQSGTTKATMLGCVLFAVVLVLGLAEIGTMSQLLTAADVYRRAGGATLVYIAPQQIDGPACDRLTTIPGIDAAGAMRPSTENERLLALPSSSVPTFEASPGFSGSLRSIRRAPTVACSSRPRSQRPSNSMPVTSSR